MNRAAVRFDEVPHDRQAETEAAPMPMPVSATFSSACVASSAN
jgi:hypothetical protein